MFATGAAIGALGTLPIQLTAVSLANSFAPSIDAFSSSESDASLQQLL